MPKRIDAKGDRLLRGLRGFVLHIIRYFESRDWSPDLPLKEVRAVDVIEVRLTQGLFLSFYVCIPG